MKIYWDGESKNIIGSRVCAFRKARKLTQSALAGMLQLEGYEVDRITISRIENGQRFVPDYEVRALAAMLGVAADELLGIN